MWDWQAGACSGTTDMLGSAIRRVEEAMLHAPGLMSGAVWRVRFRPGHDRGLDRGREGLGMHQAGPRPADLAPAGQSYGLWQMSQLRALSAGTASAEVRPCGCRYDVIVFGHDWRRHEDRDLADMTLDEQIDLLRRRLAQ